LEVTLTFVLDVGNNDKINQILFSHYINFLSTRILLPTTIKTTAREIQYYREEKESERPSPPQFLTIRFTLHKCSFARKIEECFFY
jgi:hypothetical protein